MEISCLKIMFLYFLYLIFCYETLIILIVSVEPQFALYFFGLYDGCVLLVNINGSGSLSAYNNSPRFALMVSYTMLVCFDPDCTQCEYEYE